MQIDQTNYESFLLSYVDGELKETESRQVEAFCAAHPEAAAELDLLKLTVLTPTLTVFENKAMLYREEPDRHVIGWYFSRAAIVLVLLAGTALLYRSKRPASQFKPDPDKVAAVKVVRPDTASARKDTAREVAGAKSVRTDSISSQTASVTERKVKNAPVFREKRIDPARRITPAAEDDRLSDLPARSRQITVATVRSPVTIAGNFIAPPETKSGNFISTSPRGVVAQHPVAINNTGYDADATGGNSDDAVSVLTMTKSSGVVGKLFHRLTGTKNDDDISGKRGDRKVNISIFQFAVGR